MKDRRDLEARAISELTEHGYACERARLVATYIGAGRLVARPHDWFGSFDVIAVKNHFVRFIQVTSVDAGSASPDRFDSTAVIRNHRRNIDENFPYAFNGGTVSIELWCYRKMGNKWVRSIYRRKEDGWHVMEEPAQKTLASFTARRRKILPKSIET